MGGREERKNCLFFLSSLSLSKRQSFRVESRYTTPFGISAECNAPRCARGWLEKTIRAYGFGVIERWSADSLAEGLFLLAQKAGLRPTSAEEVPPTRDIEQTAAQLDIGIQAINWQYRDFEALLKLVAPAVLQMADGGYLLLLRRRRREIGLLAPDGTVHFHPIAELADELRRGIGETHSADLNQLLTRTGLSAEKQTAAHAALLAAQLDGKELTGCWLLQLSPTAPLFVQLRHTRITHLLGLLFGIAIVQHVLLLISWYLLGRGALEQNFSLIGLWLLVLLTGIPVQLFGLWIQATVSLNTGRLLRSRMMNGILRLRPNTLRHLGSGQFFERVLRTEALQSVLLSGGLTTLLAVVQLVSAMGVLALGAGGLPHALLLALWIGLTGVVTLRYLHVHERWAHQYRTLTNGLVERMVGQRTRLAQQPPDQWHDAEDAQLADYQAIMRRLDRWQTVLSGLIGRGWLVVGLLGIAPTFIAQTPDLVRLAVSLGGIILASQALQAVTNGMLNVANARRTWRDLQPLVDLAAPIDRLGSRPIRPTPDGSLIVARDLTFSYPNRTTPTLHKLDLAIAPGDRISLTGASGSGKSTLASILAGVREPNGGMLLLHGLDRPMAGSAEWRKRVVVAPQFHENHIVAETLAFNLLLGRQWPPTESDLCEARELCHALGLGELLTRMPSGLQTMIGEGGWQLSHGEQSRLFIGRILLQNADLLILDESFAALDPTNLRHALDCVMQRAPTLLVIAHP